MTIEQETVRDQVDKYHLAEIAEIVESYRKDETNAYLEHGYRLVGIYAWSDLRHKNNTDYVKRSVFYVLGRPESVNFWAPEPEPSR